MSMTYTKLFSSITESTLWAEDDHTRIVWITMLAMADRYGRVWASVPGLAHRARVPLESAERAIVKLLGPDKHSRTKDFEGRRIAEIDGGWKLLNFLKYKAIRDQESILEAKRKYINTRRQIEREANKLSTVDQCRDIAEGEAAPAPEPIPKEVGAPKPKKSAKAATAPDDEWIEELGRSEAYKHIDVKHEYSKAAVWCSLKKRHNTRRFFVNWLNRIDRPMTFDPTTSPLPVQSMTQEEMDREILRTAQQ